MGKLLRGRRATQHSPSSGGALRAVPRRTQGGPVVRVSAIILTGWRRDARRTLFFEAGSQLQQLIDAASIWRALNALLEAKKVRMILSGAAHPLLEDDASDVARNTLLRASFAELLAFRHDAADKRALLAQGKLQMPVLAFGDEATFGPMIAVVVRRVADNVEDAIILYCGHWVAGE